MENGRLRALARIGILAAALACVAVGAPGSRADDPATLRASARGLAAAEREALLRLYAAESATTRAREQAGALEARVRTLDARVAESRRYHAIARASLRASQDRVARVLRLLYMDGPPADAFALVLGAQSLDDAVDAVESLRYAAERNQDLADQATVKAADLRAATARLQAGAASLRASRDAAARAVRELETVAADRARTLATLRTQRALTEQRLAAVQAQAEAAARRAAEVQAAATARTPDATASDAASAPAAGASAVADGGDAATPADAPEPTPAPETSPAETPAEPAAPSAPAPSAPAADGTRTLVVSSTAYSLQGTTASGLPVGPGIIAVDPSVIPLGTRVYVPGYGEAVAADTGSAVQGAIIDVWLPTYEQAIGWGRRTVTITIYRS